MNNQDKISRVTFAKWCWNTKESKHLILTCGVAVILQFIYFKYLYPYPNFLPDSYSYIEAAYANRTVNTWPVGYSNFLRLVSSFTKSHTALVLIQYLLLQSSILYLIFTISYQFSLNRWMIRILLCISVLNPLLLHVANFVSSDALFACLSLIWLTQLLWILYKPDIRIFIVHGLILLLVFTVRYNALYYPIISFAVILATNTNIYSKAVGAAIILLLPASYIKHTENRYRIVTGTEQFSAFSGWQLASNALFAYARTHRIPITEVPPVFRSLHSIANRHLDSLDRSPDRPDKDLGIYYLWDDQAPLKRYMRTTYQSDTITSDFKKWAAMSPLYLKYGYNLIRKSPMNFAKHYLWPNMIRYYVPDPEFLGVYNLGRDTVNASATVWFNLGSPKVHSFRKDKLILSTSIFPILSGVMNLLFIVSFAACAYLGMFNSNTVHMNRSLICILSVWVLNLVFSVLASPVVLRYQVFPLIITSVFLFVLASFVLEKSWPSNKKKKKYEIQSRNKSLSTLPS